MKKVLLGLSMAVAFVSCEREVNVDVTVPTCEECQGATISLVSQMRGPVNRDDMYAWIDVITVVAEDDLGMIMEMNLNW